ncbi:protein Barley B recombinant-like [Typha latifolia]|uniref:protein Barley B recombinant-like n=1 Tax=Typha latifolia TaxID=4733 RepID=UPI003C2D2F40
MDDDGGLDMRNWGYYEQHMKGGLGLQLMPSAAERDTKPFLWNGDFLHRDCGVPEPSVAVGFARDGWIHHNRENNYLHGFPGKHHSSPNFGIISNPPTAHTFQMLQSPEPEPEPGPELPKDVADPMIDDPICRDETPLRKKSRGRPNKLPKTKRPKKVAAPRDDSPKSGKKSIGMVINGMDLDISRVPPPVCSCTGVPKQCYRWGAGGWQSACCTTSMSIYPLPMSTKRRGTRIAGRKMSIGTFKKVLEKVAGEGHNLSSPIDLRSFWAKHGTNKFATIR